MSSRDDSPASRNGDDSDEVVKPTVESEDQDLQEERDEGDLFGSDDDAGEEAPRYA